MNEGDIAHRLRRKLSREGWGNLLVGCGALLLALVAAVVTWWVICLVAVFFAPRSAAGDGILYFAFVATALLFPLHALLEPQKIIRLELPNQTDPYGAPTVLFVRREVIGTDMDPNSWRDSIRYLVGTIGVAPLLLRLASDMIVKGVRLLRLDITQLGPVMALVTARRGRVPYSEIFQSFPHLPANWMVRALNDIDGVTFLNSPPAGISFTAELREELCPLEALSQTEEARGPQEAAPQPVSADLAGDLPEAIWETESSPMNRPPFRASELLFTLIVRSICGGLLGLGAFALMMFGPRRGGSVQGRIEWLEHPSLAVPLLFVFGGAVICVLSTPRWMWRGGLG